MSKFIQKFGISGRRNAVRATHCYSFQNVINVVYLQDLFVYKIKFCEKYSQAFPVLFLTVEKWLSWIAMAASF